MAFEIKPATRTGVKPLIGMYGKSGGGKTLSALYLARGLVGPKGRITLVDSESGRGSLFADIVPGGYSVIDLDEPFSPDRYQEAIETAEKQSDIVVVDSLSHGWAGEGGVLDMQEAELTRMAGDNYGKREACKMAAWIKPKAAHKKFVQRLLRMKCGLIVCLRGEEKTHIQKKDGKNTVITDEFSSPLYDQRFIFELLLNFEVVAKDGKGGYVIPRKITHPTIAPLLPKENEQIGIAHGEALAKWCLGVTGGATTTPATKTAASGRNALLAKLRDVTVKVHGWKVSDGKEAWTTTGKPAMLQFLADELGMVTRIDDWTDEEIQSAITKATEKLAAKP